MLNQNILHCLQLHFSERSHTHTQCPCASYSNLICPPKLFLKPGCLEQVSLHTLCMCVQCKSTLQLTMARGTRQFTKFFFLSLSPICLLVSYLMPLFWPTVLSISKIIFRPSSAFIECFTFFQNCWLPPQVGV